MQVHLSVCMSVQLSLRRATVSTKMLSGCRDGSCFELGPRDVSGRDKISVPFRKLKKATYDTANDRT
jgi:hypothetical protein